jgi:hypothetical protein
MSLSHLSPEQAQRAERIFQSLRQETEADLRGLAELLASKEDGQIPGATEFEVRDRVHKIGAKAIETALNERKRGGIKGRARVAPTVTRRLASWAIAPKARSACSGLSDPGEPITIARPAIGASAPSMASWAWPKAT